jgi:osmoprotectant transport system substrate-binding protein
MIHLRNGAVVLALVSTLAACSSSTATDGGTEPVAAAASADLKGEKISLGTKGFTEHFLLTQITKLMLEKSGAEVSVRDLPSTQQVRQAMQSGDIDMYWEYTGTGWTNFLGHETADTTDAQELHSDVAEEDLAKNGVKWLPPASFNDTYGIAVREEAAEELQVTTTSDLAELVSRSAKDATLCVDESFGDRPDGLPAVENKYGFDWPDKAVTVSDYALIFPSTDKGKPCNFGAVYTTDGRLSALGLKVLEDDKGAFISYLPALTMTKERYASVGEKVEQVVEPLLSALDQETITRLNAEVDVDGEFPEDVAEKWLTEQGFL